LKKDFNINNLVAELKKNKIPYETSELNRTTLIKSLQSGVFSSLVCFGIGSGGECRSFFHAEVQWNIIMWVTCGGRFILHGEGEGEHRVMPVCRNWFGRIWQMKGDFYRRTVHNLQSSCTYLTPDILNMLPLTVNAKACMITNVPVEERVYSPESGAVVHSFVHLPGFAGEQIDSGLNLVAMCSFGKGRFAFIGDVNAEQSSMAVIRVLGSFLSRLENAWIRRRVFMTMLHQSSVWSVNEKSSAKWSVFSMQPLCALIMSYI